MNSRRYQRESEFRFALFQANQQMQSLASLRGEEREESSLGLGLEKVVEIVHDIVGATAKLTWVTAGYGWVSIVAPLLIASPAYFSVKMSFSELMVVVGAFYQVNQSLRWFVDNFAMIAEWRAALSRVIAFREVLSKSQDPHERDHMFHLQHPADRSKIHNRSGGRSGTVLADHEIVERLFGHSPSEIFVRAEGLKQESAIDRSALGDFRQGGELLFRRG
jgi:putative ATP-binding cassette transporter